MDRAIRIVMILVGVSLSLGLFADAPVVAEDAAPAKRPNIVFIFTDDHAAHAISAYGSKINQTPHIDRLAREGMLFENAFCTNALCGPSRAVILTGKHSHINGFMRNGNKFDGEQPTFPKMLQKAGYQTALIGKWHLGTTPSGFDYWEILPGQGSYYNPDFQTPRGRVQYEGYATDVTTDLALTWLKESRDADKPFMLMLQHKAPHRSWMPGPDHLTHYNDVQIPEPPTLFDDYSHRTSAAAKQAMSIANHLHPAYDLKLDRAYDGGDPKPWELGPINRLNREQRAAWDAAYDPQNQAFREANLTGDALTRYKYQRYIKDYLRCIASVDDNIGRVLDYLDESGLAENTIVIYASDQGFFLGDHGWYDKRWMYEQSLRLPLIVRWPGTVKPSTRDTHLVQNLDFAETFLDIAGVEQPDDMQGRSLVPLLKGESVPWRDAIYYHYYETPSEHRVPRHYGVRTDRYKLIHYDQINEWELFDLAKDPDELKSVYSDAKYADVVEQLKQRLAELREQYAVPGEE